MKTYFFLAVLLLAIFLIYAFIPRLQQPLSEDQARAFLAQDLGSSEAEWRVLETRQNGETWEFDVLVVENAHSVCPTAEKRFYKLPPVSYRPEPFINACYERSKIFFREEALINSAKKLGVRDGYGCAFKANANWFEEKSYCPVLDEATMASFAQGLPANSWIALWKLGDSINLIALDEDNNILKTA